MKGIVEDASYEEKLALVLKHPELGKRIKMSDASVKEQSGAGLDSLSADEFEIFSALNQTYMEKFNFPFIIAVSGKDKYAILKAMQERVLSEEDQEFKTALQEIYKIASLRFKIIIQSDTYISS